MEHSGHNENKKNQQITAQTETTATIIPSPARQRFLSLSRQERKNLSLSSLTEHKEKGISVSHGNFPLTVSSVFGIIKKI